MNDIRDENVKENKCFVIMPISDSEGYDSGHFLRVYNHLIKPACKKTNFIPIRADETQSTNYIVIDILQNILSSELVICDLSSRNPNVLYELGIRQAFNLPAVLIKDERTERIFDIQGIRTLEYHRGLRVDTIEGDVIALENTIKNTINSRSKEINSLIQLLGVKKAEIPDNITVPAEIVLVLDAIKEISHRINNLENLKYQPINKINNSKLDQIEESFTLPNGQIIYKNEPIRLKNGILLGYLNKIDDKGIHIIQNQIYPNVTIIPPDDERFSLITK